MASLREKRRAQQMRDHLDECEVLLAAVALQYGTDGRLVVSGEHIASVADLAKTRPLAVRVLISGDLRIDFEEPELTMQVVEEPACIST